MSDLSIYELEDIIWDDFDRSDDHIVPHTGSDHGSEDKCNRDSCKKPRREGPPLQSNGDTLYASDGSCQVKEERDCETLNKKRNMMENHTPDSVFTASCDASLECDDTRISNHCFKSSNMISGSELCTDDRILNDSSAAADSNSYNYSLSHIHQEDDLNLFSNDCEDKESSDLLYYGWPDIGNFEDVDRMLSNCDSSLGLGVTGNDDELVWFTSEDPAGGYDEALKMDLTFPCPEPSSLTNISQDHEPLESNNKGSSCMPESKDEFKLKDQRKQSKHQNRIGGPMMTGIKSENKDVTSSSMETAYASNQPSVNENQKQTGKMLQASRSDLGSSQKQFYIPEKKIESETDVKGVNKEASAETVPEGSSVSYVLDEISLEATAFCQLQQVMEQLDMRTRLCIRDSLYRLARSAEQRHNYAGLCGSNANYGGPLTERTNKCAGFVDMETDTNPIDRTVAHLLFHRPSDSSLKPNAKLRRDKIFFCDAV